MTGQERKFNDEDSGKFSSGVNALARGLHVAFIMLALFIVAVIIWYFTFGGYFTVNPQENVLVIRFGKFIKVETDGWHWSFPYPVSRLVRVPTSKQTITLSTFMHKADVNAIKGEQMQQPGGPLVPGRDGYLLTGDVNIIHTEWELVFTITEPAKFYLKCLCPDDPMKGDENIMNLETLKPIGTRGPRTLIQALLDNCVLKATAVQKVDNALYKESSAYMIKVQELLEKEVQKWDIGIKVENVILKRKTPPLNTVAAFQDVIEAEQESSAEKQNAKAYAVKIVNETDAECSQITADANVYKIRIVSEIESEQVYFKKILEEYRKNKSSVLIALYTDTVTELLAGVKEKYLVPPGGKERQEIRIMLNPEPKRSNKENKEE